MIESEAPLPPTAIGIGTAALSLAGYRPNTLPIQTGLVGGTIVKGDKYGPADLHSTIAKALGLPIDKRIHGAGGRPFFVGNRGKVIEQAFS